MYKYIYIFNIFMFNFYLTYICLVFIFIFYHHLLLLLLLLLFFFFIAYHHPQSTFLSVLRHCRKEMAGVFSGGLHNSETRLQSSQQTPVYERTYAHLGQSHLST